MFRGSLKFLIFSVNIMGLENTPTVSLPRGKTLLDMTLNNLIVRFQ